jgi:murein L,D-transpeptidase YafK
MIYIFKPFKPIDKSVSIDNIVVDKSDRKLTIYEKGKVVKTYSISIGKVPQGAKEVEGDMKTPEGLYVINDKNSNSGYHKNLGISYPNNTDIERAKKLGKSPGGLIKIHGIKNGYGWIGQAHLLKDWTLGCIAVTDKEIDELFKMVKIGTPIEIRP